MSEKVCGCHNFWERGNVASSLCLARRKRREEGGEGHKRHVCLSPPVPSLPSELHRDLENGEEGEVGGVCVYLKPILSRSKKGKGKGASVAKNGEKSGGRRVARTRTDFPKMECHTHTASAWVVVGNTKWTFPFSFSYSGEGSTSRKVPLGTRGGTEVGSTKGSLPPGHRRKKERKRGRSANVIPLWGVTGGGGGGSGKASNVIRWTSPSPPPFRRPKREESDSIIPPSIHFDASALPKKDPPTPPPFFLSPSFHALPPRWTACSHKEKL